MTATGQHSVVLFGTCFTNYNRPEVGEAAYRVLTHNDCQIACPSLSCCGTRVLHPVEVLDRAYREDGFATKVEAKAEG